VESETGVELKHALDERYIKSTTAKIDIARLLQLPQDCWAHFHCVSNFMQCAAARTTGSSKCPSFINRHDAFLPQLVSSNSAKRLCNIYAMCVWIVQSLLMPE
jgi:hypothetical protein